VIDNAARQGDARGDHAFAVKLLDNGLAKFPDAPLLDRARALLYRAELAVRSGDRSAATESLAGARAVDLSEAEEDAIFSELAHATEIVEGMDRTGRLSQSAVRPAGPGTDAHTTSPSLSISSVACIPSEAATRCDAACPGWMWAVNVLTP
jgi:hypothetical protein